jgi:hypothetical protein
MMLRPRWRLYIIAALIVVFGATVPLMVKSWHQKQTFDATFDAYARAVRSRDYRMAYEMAGAEFRATTSYDEFVQANRSLASSFGEIRAIEPGETEVEGRGDPKVWAGVVHSVVHFDHGSAPMVFEFHEEAGVWKLYGFKKM